MKPSLLRDFKIAFFAIAVFYGVLFTLNFISAAIPEPTTNSSAFARAVYVTFGSMFGLADVMNLLAKVAVGGTLAWLGLSWGFPKTLGMDIGDKFDDGWREMSYSDRTKIIIVAFLVIFFATVHSKGADVQAVTKGVAVPVSYEARDLIIQYEVGGGRSYYDAHLARPTVPAWQTTQSGVTVGIGVDVGQMTREQVARAFSGILSDEAVRALQSACGMKGRDAYYNALPKVRNTVLVPWDKAVKVFETDTLPRFTKQTKDAFALSFDRLHPHSSGALLSIVFNRGPSMNGSSRLEMRLIRDDIATGNDQRVPGHIKDMKRLWSYSTLKGLHLRRDSEAALFLKGVNLRQP
jgi:hypothetical protein